MNKLLVNLFNFPSKCSEASFLNFKTALSELLWLALVLAEMVLTVLVAAGVGGERKGVKLFSGKIEQISKMFNSLKNR